MRNSTLLVHKEIDQVHFINLAVTSCQLPAFHTFFEGQAKDSEGSVDLMTATKHIRKLLGMQSIFQTKAFLSAL